MKRGSIQLFVGGGFGVIGPIFLVIGLVFGANALALAGRAERADGTVVEVVARTTSNSDGTRSTSWYPTVAFEAGEKTVRFVSSVGFGPSRYEVGDTVPVAYDPDHPSDAKIATFGGLYLFPLLFGGLGLVFTAVGIPLAVSGFRKRRTRSRLLRSGSEAWGEIVDIGPDFGVRINRQHPYVVRATWRNPFTGLEHTATSDYIMRDPGPELAGHTHVRVLYDPEKPDDAIIDLQTPPR